MPESSIKLSPLHEIARDLEATFADVDHWRVAERFAGVEIETTAATTGVVLFDETAKGRIQVEGDASDTVLTSAFTLPNLEVGAGTHHDGTNVVRLRQDLFYLSVPPGAEAETIEKVRAQANGSLVTATDITDGRTASRVIGPDAPTLMSKVCGLDFSEPSFPDGHARQSSVARTNQLIIRNDLQGNPAYSLVGSRSLGAYLWSVLMEAGAEWDIRPIGRSAHHELEKSTT